MSTTEVPEVPGPTRNTGRQRVYLWLAIGLPVLILVAVFAILRWAPSPVETALVVGGLLLVGLSVAGYLGCRHGVVAPYIAVALILPYLLGAVAVYGSASRVSDELGSLFDEGGVTSGEGGGSWEFKDENDDGVADDTYSGMKCGDITRADYGSEWESVKEECLANGGRKGSSGGGTQSEPGDDGPPQLPLDGGSYTWSSGVKMSLKVVRTEPWGSTDDYCGDGSCGVSDPNDLRWVLHYEVSVPEEFGQPMDPMSCPGELHIVNGNDDESIIGVAGNYDHPLEGKIFPGATKTGDSEYSIERSAVGQEFYLESTCGDPDGAEVAYFTGVIDE
jgi:hypothetical protein